MNNTLDFLSLYFNLFYVGHYHCPDMSIYIIRNALDSTMTFELKSIQSPARCVRAAFDQIVCPLAFILSCFDPN